MREITAQDIMHLEFLKKECFTGSHEGMRYRMAKQQREVPVEAGEDPESAAEGNKPQEDKTETITELLVTVWPEPFCYDRTPEEEKTSQCFPFSEEGIESGRIWLNEQCAAVDWQERALPWR